MIYDLELLTKKVGYDFKIERTGRGFSFRLDGRDWSYTSPKRITILEMLESEAKSSEILKYLLSKCLIEVKSGKNGLEAIGNDCRLSNILEYVVGYLSAIINLDEDKKKE